jgi:hypothetical protein
MAAAAGSSRPATLIHKDSVHVAGVVGPSADGLSSQHGPFDVPGPRIPLSGEFVSDVLRGVVLIHGCHRANQRVQGCGWSGVPQL